MKLLAEYIKYKKRPAAAFLLCIAIIIFSSRLYKFPAKAVIYQIVLCVITGTAFFCRGFVKSREKLRKLAAIKALPTDITDELPEPGSPEEKEYCEIINRLCCDRKEISEKNSEDYSEMIDYYTLWAHQIKTPISSMGIILQNEDSELSRKLRIELKQIEVYVNMVMTFLRLNSDSSDYRFEECRLDGIIRPVIKRFAGEFIGKKLSLDYRIADSAVVLTDEKWISFVAEQVISNAVKYTNSGSISVYMENENVLAVRDTGIGILPEDMPRIFEKGYTGFNGRTDKRASGIGLYLCKRICDNLSHEISAESEPGSGTVIRIKFNRKKYEFE